VPPLSGYDAGAHAGYLLTLAREGRLPHPLEGWSTFHPPLYYLLGSAVWRALEPHGPRALAAGLQGLSAAAGLATGLASYALVRRLGAGLAVAWVATALVLFVPCQQMAAVMIGNEALAAAFSAAALLPLLSLQRDPGRAGQSALAGLCAGLALATKYTGAFAALACAVPFLRADLGRRERRALAAGALVTIALALPVYARNLWLTGTPLPILREHEPTRSQEERNVLRPRRPADYLWPSPAALWRPSIYHVRGDSTSELRRNPAMTSVWGLAYASIWYDAFAHRIPTPYHRDGIWSGRLLVLLGLVPTALLLAGLGLATRDALRTRGRSPDAPLAALWLAGLAGFVAFTAWAPSLVAVKGSYLLPLAPAGAACFARAAAALPAPARAAALAVSAAAALFAALVFSEGLVFRPQPPQKMAAVWRVLGSQLPTSNIVEAVDRLGRGD
jgi:4-amino-4-deoxy-L-arabinose transferase-like glycosyltransferase